MCLEKLIVRPFKILEINLKLQIDVILRGQSLKSLTSNAERLKPRRQLERRRGLKRDAMPLRIVGDQLSRFEVIDVTLTKVAALLQ
jgi:hypothetical protein